MGDTQRSSVMGGVSSFAQAQGQGAGKAEAHPEQGPGRDVRATGQESTFRVVDVLAELLLIIFARSRR